MAFTTLTSFGRELTRAEKDSMNDYVKAQMALGNTDGVSYVVDKTGLEGMSFAGLRERAWQTQDQANAWVTFCNTFDPAPTWCEVLIPGQPYIIQNPTGPIPTPPGTV